MISMEAHVYAYYLNLAKGRMSDAARMAGINPNTFTRKAHRYGVNFRNFRGPMCACTGNGVRCKLCAHKNRVAARNRYHTRKHRAVLRQEGMDRTQRMLFLSAKMSALQRIMQLSK